VYGLQVTLRIEVFLLTEKHAHAVAVTGILPMEMLDFSPVLNAASHLFQHTFEMKIPGFQLLPPSLPTLHDRTHLMNMFC